MADAATTIFGIIKPEVGASADTWGGKQNNNRDLYDKLFGAIATGGSSNAYTLTTGESYSALVTGMRFCVRWNHTNSGAATLNVDGIGAVALTKNGTTALASGDAVSGRYAIVAYDGTQWQVVAGISFQPLDAQLTTWAGFSPQAGSLPYWTDATTLADLVTSAASRAVLSAGSNAAIRALLDLEAGTDFYSYSAADTTFAKLSGATFTGDVAIDKSSTPLLDLKVSGVSKAQMFVSSTTNFLLGAAGQEWKFYTDGDVSMTLDTSHNLTVVGTVTGSSDAKFKTEIEDLSEQEAIEFLCGLRPRTFRKHGVRLVGFIAQEVAQVDERYVFENESRDEHGELIDTYLSLPAGAEWAAPLVRGFQALARRVAALESR